MYWGNIRATAGALRLPITKVVQLGLTALLLLGLTGLPNRARAQGDGGILFNTSLTSLDLHILNGVPIPIPLGPGYSIVNSDVRITLSSMRTPTPGPASIGQAIARSPVGGNVGGTIDPNALHGQQFFVNSFFDVFFDVTLTDIDAGNNYFSNTPILQALDIGPAHMENTYLAIFDKDAPNFGLIPPPQSAPYIGHFNIEIPLGADVNGNGELDKIKFTVAQHATVDGSATFIILPDGTVLDTFDSAAFLDGAVVDISTDPPFSIGALGPNGGPDPAIFGGPTTATSKLVNPLVGAAAPEPGSLALIVVTCLVVTRRFRRR